jgi:hypothetical protein
MIQQAVSSGLQGALTVMTMEVVPVADRYGRLASQRRVMEHVPTSLSYAIFFRP